jgi:hypothetical protein
MYGVVRPAALCTLMMAGCVKWRAAFGAPLPIDILLIDALSVGPRCHEHAPLQCWWRPQLAVLLHRMLVIKVPYSTLSSRQMFVLHVLAIKYCCSTLHLHISADSPMIQCYYGSARRGIPGCAWNIIGGGCVSKCWPRAAVLPSRTVHPWSHREMWPQRRPLGQACGLESLTAYGPCCEMLNFIPTRKRKSS